MGRQSFPGFLLLLFSFLVLNQQRNFKKQVAILLLCNAVWMWYHRFPPLSPPFLSLRFFFLFFSFLYPRRREGLLFLFFSPFFLNWAVSDLLIYFFLAPTNDFVNQWAFLYFLYPSFGFLRASRPRVGMYLRYLPQQSSATTRLIKFLFLSCNLS